MPAPCQLRLAAHTKGQTVLSVSPTLSVPTADPLPVVIGIHTATATLMVPQTIDDQATTSSADIFLIRSGGDGYAMNVRTLTNPSALPLFAWISTNEFAGLDHSAEFTTLSISGLAGYAYETTDESGPTRYVWLDDPADALVFAFSFAPTDGQQATNFVANLPEILTILNSFHR